MIKRELFMFIEMLENRFTVYQIWIISITLQYMEIFNFVKRK